MNEQLEQLEIQSGTLLVADEKLKGPIFAKSVILVVRHADSGTVGINIAGPKYGDSPFRNGGPLVETLAPFVVLSNEGTATLITADADESQIDDLSDPSKHVFLGYAGWGAGQLAREISNGVWHFVTMIDLPSLLAASAESRWQMAWARRDGATIEIFDCERLKFDPAA